MKLQKCKAPKTRNSQRRRYLPVFEQFLEMNVECVRVVLDEQETLKAMGLFRAMYNSLKQYPPMEQIMSVRMVDDQIYMIRKATGTQDVQVKLEPCADPGVSKYSPRR